MSKVTHPLEVVFVRHGKSEHNGNAEGNYWYSTNPKHPKYRVSNLLDEGVEAVHETAKELLKKGINAKNSIAFVSPLPRTQQTAAILRERGGDKSFLDHSTGSLL